MRPKTADAEDYQINRDDEVQYSGHEQDKDASDQCYQRLQQRDVDVDVHREWLLGGSSDGTIWSSNQRFRLKLRATSGERRSQERGREPTVPPAPPHMSSLHPL
jgi:hypothetical protein